MTTYYIAYENRGWGKIHGNARCGSTRKNLVHNTPYLLEEGLEEDNFCKRCGGPTTIATRETIIEAWKATIKQSRRVGMFGQGMDVEYCQKVARRQIAELEAK